MQSIKAELDKHREDFLREVKLWGTWKAMRKYGIKPTGYVTVCEYIMEVTQDVNYGLYPELTTLDDVGGNNPFEVLIEKFANYVVRTKIEGKKKDERIVELSKQLSYYEERDIELVQDRLASIIVACDEG